MDEEKVKFIIEALLMSAEKPLSLEQIAGVFDEWQRPTVQLLEKAINSLTFDYEPRAISLRLLASGYCFQTKPDYGIWVSRLQAEKPAKYSRALLETLAIIAYKQPVTRADIEDIRGVSVSSAMLKTLLERDWIKIVGHRDVPGKPAVYSTTKTFLDYFNLTSIEQLPPLQTIVEVKTEECVTNE